MWERVNPTIRLALIFMFWMMSILVRALMHVEPWQMLWFMWIAAHSVAGACFGFYLCYYVYVEPHKKR